MLFWFRKLSVDFWHFRLFIFFAIEHIRKRGIHGNFIVTVFWGDIFLKHNLLMFLLFWLSIWWLLWNFSSISGSQPGFYFYWPGRFPGIVGNAGNDENDGKIHRSDQWTFTIIAWKWLFWLLKPKWYLDNKLIAC